MVIYLLFSNIYKSFVTLTYSHLLVFSAATMFVEVGEFSYLPSAISKFSSNI